MKEWIKNRSLINLFKKNHVTKFLVLIKNVSKNALENFQVLGVGN